MLNYLKRIFAPLNRPVSKPVDTPMDLPVLRAKLSEVERASGYIYCPSQRAQGLQQQINDLESIPQVKLKNNAAPIYWNRQ